MSKYDVTVDRWKYIGGSDLKTIMQLDTFKNRFDLLLEKCQLKEPEQVENEYTIDGHINEEKIRNYYNETKFKSDHLEENQVISEDGVYRYNADGVNSKIVWECKRVGKATFEAINNPRDKENKKYLVQLLKGIQLNNKQSGLLTISLRNGDFDETKIDELKEFEININDYQDILSEIDYEVGRFLDDKEKMLKNPLITEEELQPNELIELSNEVEKLEKQLLDNKKIEERQKKVKQELFKAMEKHNVKKWITNNGTQITRVDSKPDEEVDVTTYDEKKFIEENIELHEAYHNKLAEYKIIKKEIKKGKSGYVKITLPKEE